MNKRFSFNADLNSYKFPILIIILILSMSPKLVSVTLYSEVHSIVAGGTAILGKQN